MKYNNKSSGIAVSLLALMCSHLQDELKLICGCVQHIKIFAQELTYFIHKIIKAFFFSPVLAMFGAKYFFPGFRVLVSGSIQWQALHHGNASIQDLNIHGLDKELHIIRHIHILVSLLDEQSTLGSPVTQSIPYSLQPVHIFQLLEAIFTNNYLHLKGAPTKALVALHASFFFSKQTKEEISS